VELVKFVAPSGAQWELFVTVAVIVLAPIVVERFRLPGMVGLLFAGMAIGPNVLGIVPSDSGVVAELGSLGLLYLMFMAGLDLDLNVFAKVRRQAIAFSVLTFTVPFVLGVVIGSAVGYELAAAVLLGAVFASHTLVTYPLLRTYGLSTNRAVAITVGATVITDTLALIVLAAVSGTATGDVSGWALASQLAVGLAILGVTCFVVMPMVGRWFFRTVGRTRVARYTFIVGILLGGATVAAMVGIEPIVGAFFAGLAINRLVPSEGEMMEHIEFFGAAILIPIFLVSVGTVIDPTKLVALGTLGLAAWFALGALGGKLIASAIARFVFHLSWNEAGAMFSLSVSRAAATLAATFVGLQIGLFDTATVNAIMLVIVLSLVASSTSATFFGSRVPRPAVESERVGRSVLVQLELDGSDGILATLAARLARVDGGVVRPLYVVAPGWSAPTNEQTRTIDHEIAGLGADATLEVRHDRSVEDGLVNAAASYGSSLILARESGAGVLTLGRGLDAPVAVVRPAGPSFTRAVLVLTSAHATHPQPVVLAAISVAVRLERSGVAVLVVCDHDLDPTVEQALGTLTVHRAPVLEAIDVAVDASDLVVVAGGRVSGGATGRVDRRATQRGASVMVITDPDDVEWATEAAAVAAPLTAG
jgi:Kef-type K+ transport system membrane component KefB